MKLKKKIYKKWREFILLHKKHIHRVHYYDSTSNFGDLINKDIFAEYLTNPVNTKIKYANFLMIGSLLQTLITDNPREKFKNKKYGILNIFGSGFIAEPIFQKEYFKREVRFYGIRRKLSLDRIKNMGFDTKDVILGDPGLLVDDFYKIEKSEPIYDIGIIAHYADKNLPIIGEIARKYNNSHIIDIGLEPRNFLRELVKCKTIISSAMHGLIAADSYNIPNVWMKLSDNLAGGNYKFRDYYSVFDLEPQFILPQDFDQITNLPEYIKTNYPISKIRLDQIKENLKQEFQQLRKFSHVTKIS